MSTLWRRYRQDLRDLAVRHARERAAFTAWVIEVDHRLIHGEDTIIPNSRRPVLPGNRTED